jgi:hypothetical protein
MEASSLVPFGEGPDFVMKTESLESISRDRCFPCFSRRFLVSGAKNRDMAVCAKAKARGICV